MKNTAKRYTYTGWLNQGPREVFSLSIGSVSENIKLGLRQPSIGDAVIITEWGDREKKVARARISGTQVYQWSTNRHKVVVEWRGSLPLPELRPERLLPCRPTL